MIGRRLKKRPVAGVDYDERVYHRPPAGFSNFGAGLIAFVLSAILIWLAFTKDIPFTGAGFQLNASFNNAATLREDSPVRIAGVNVGKVTAVERDGDLTRATFTVSEEGLPVHTDAELTIRPRLFLEGNFFVDLQPGSPSAPELGDGDSIKASQTAVAVQLDEVLTALQQPDRRNLSLLLEGFGTTLTYEPGPADDRDQDPDVRGETAAEALNDTFQYGGTAGRATARVNEALLGTEPGDLRRLVGAGGRVFTTLADREQQLRDLITNFNVTVAAFADEAANLRASIRELAPTVEEARPALAELSATFPPLRAFSEALRPGVRELPATIEAGDPWLRQTFALLGDDELGGLTPRLARATPDLAAGTASLSSLVRQAGLLGRCTTDVLIPTGNTVITDDFTTGVENYKEFFFSVVNQNGEAAEFDGNGQILRAQVLTGSVRVTTPNPGAIVNDDVLYGNTLDAPVGTQPTLSARRPPQRSDVACHTNDPPDLNGPAAAVGAPSPEATP